MIAAIRAWAPPVLWAALVFVGSSGEIRAPGPRIPHLDKVAHFVEYGVLGLLLCRALLLTAPRLAVARAACLAAGLAVLYGVSDEFHQSLVPGRTPDVADLGADLAGAVAGAALWARWTRRAREAAAPSPTTSAG